MAELQQRVIEMFDRLKDSRYWTQIDADKTENALHDELLQAVENIITASANKDLGRLW